MSLKLLSHPPLRLSCFIFLIAVESCQKSIQTDSTASLNCLPPNLQTGVIAFYSFSAGSLNDNSGNNYNLSNGTSASPGTDRAGNVACAFRFDRNNNESLRYTNPSFADDFQTLPFSISLWYRNTTRSAPNYELLIGRDSIRHCPDTYGQWSVGLYDLRKPVFGINEHSLWWPDTTITDTLTWKHYVVTCQGNDLKLYINGVLTSNQPGYGCNTNTPTLNAGDLLIGKYYSGCLDDIVIYNRILTPADVTGLYNTPACCE